MSVGYVSKYLGVDTEEGLAVGDGDNGVSMLRAVRYGVAVRNGTKSCRDAAVRVTGSNQEDGVEQAVKLFAGDGQGKKYR